MKKIGILGSGGVAKTLGSGFLKHGYDVMLGSRDQSKLAEWLSGTDGKAKTGSFEEAAKFGDIIVLAINGKHAADVLNLAGASNLEGKTIIDATNPIDETAGPVNGALRFFTPANSSLMEQLQNEHPKAHFVKAFNSVGAAFMVDPQFPGGKPTMFICGNEVAAKKETTDILTEFGWETEDMGPAEVAGSIEQLCILWCAPGFLKNQWTHAFKLLKM